MSQGKNTFKIAGIGEILWDLLPDGKELGGAPANFAYHCTKLGAAGYIISKVGNDDLGREIQVQLKQKGINQQYLGVDDLHPTSTVSVTIDAAGIPEYKIHESIAWDFLESSQSLKSFAGELDAVCCGTLALRSTVSSKTIRQFLSATRPGCIRVLDINLRGKYYSKSLIEKMLHLVAVLKLNDEEITIVSKLLGFQGTETDQLKELIQRFHLDLIVLSKGDKGSRLMSTDEDIEIPAPEVKRIVDTVGAGDAYTAVVVMGLLQKKPLAGIGKKASQVAAYICSQKGAMPP